MAVVASAVLPKKLLAPKRHEKHAIHVSPVVVESAAKDAAGVYALLKTRSEGLTTNETEARLAEHGPNVLAKDQRTGTGKLLWHAVLKRFPFRELVTHSIRLRGAGTLEAR
jgi:P-type Mg2+ transporter